MDTPMIHLVAQVLLCIFLAACMAIPLAILVAMVVWGMKEVFKKEKKQ